MKPAKVAWLVLALAALASAVGSVLAGGTLPVIPGGSAPPLPPWPVITQFQSEWGDNDLCTFYGKVSAPGGVANLTIEFGSLRSLIGRSVPVNPDGSFSLTVMLGPNETGIATATLVDFADEELDEAYSYVP
jgi:hypothetical protein